MVSVINWSKTKIFAFEIRPTPSTKSGVFRYTNIIGVILKMAFNQKAKVSKIKAIFFRKIFFYLDLIFLIHFFNLKFKPFFDTKFESFLAQKHHHVFLTSRTSPSLLRDRHLLCTGSFKSTVNFFNAEEKYFLLKSLLFS